MRYLWQRFKPFAYFMIVAEVAVLLGKIYQSFGDFSFAPWELLKMLAVLALTSVIAFMYMMIPYLLFLLILPQSKQNSRLDKVVTVVMFTTFVYTGLFQVAGFVAGVAVAKRLPVQMLRRGIGALCCLLGLFLLGREVLGWIG